MLSVPPGFSTASKFFHGVFDCCAIQYAFRACIIICRRYGQYNIVSLVKVSTKSSSGGHIRSSVAFSSPKLRIIDNNFDDEATDSDNIISKCTVRIEWWIY